MSKVILNNLVNLENENTAVTFINQNNDTIEAAFDNTLSRDGTSPNTMGASLDMNSNRILNLPTPVSSSEPLRLQELADLTSGGVIHAIPSGGTTNQVLKKNSDSDYDVSWATSTGTVTSVGLSAPAEFTVTNSPVTTTGTLTLSKANQNANLVYAGPNTGAAAAPSFRSLVPADMPSLTLTGDVTGSASGGSIATTIEPNKVTNAQLANTAADSTIKSNISGSTGNVSDNTITAVLDKQFGTTQGSVVYRGASAWSALTPGSAGNVLVSGGAGANPSWGSAAGTGTVTQVNGSSFLAGGPITSTGTLVVVGSWRPSGRVTLTTLTPVMPSTVTGATSHYYTPYVGNICPIYDGSNMVLTTFSELSQAATDATKSPAAVAANKVYDLFVWNDGGTIRCTRGPAWTNTTTRGYTLTMVNGILTNTSAITNGPAANRGTFVGTIMSNGSSTYDFAYGGLAAGGSAGIVGVWNMYNRVDFVNFIGDTTDSWTYGTATWRAANNSSTIRTTFVNGSVEDSVSFVYQGTCTGPGTGAPIAAVGYDSTTAPSGSYAFGTTSANQSCIGTYSTLPAIGVHFGSAVEFEFAGGTTTWYGDNAGNGAQSGFHTRWRY